MPRYQITAPDGRTVVVEGDRAPTEADAVEIFSQLPAKEQPAQAADIEYTGEIRASNYGMMDRARDAISKVRNTQAVMSVLGRSDTAPEGTVFNKNSFAGQMADGAYETAGATAGQFVGSRTPYAPVAAPILGGTGAAIGSIAGQVRRGEPISPGETAGAFVRGMVPFGSTARGVAPVVKEGVKQGLGNALSTAVEAGIDEQRIATPEELAISGGAGAVAPIVGKVLDKGKNAIAQAIEQKKLVTRLRNETLKAAKELDLVIPPSAINPGTVNNTLDSVGGKAAAAQQAIEANQEQINKAVREEIKVATLDPATIELAKARQALVYREAAAISPKAKAYLEAYKRAESDAKNLFYQNSQRYDAGILKQAQARQKDADVMWAKLENEARVAGKKDLPDRLDAARVEYAKISTVERAMNPGDGNINAMELGRMLDKGEKLTGKLATIARFANAFPRYAKEASGIPPSGTNQMNMMLGGIAAGGADSRNGAIARFLAMTGAPRAARSLALSPTWQRYMAQPNFGRAPADVPAFMLRYGMGVAGQSGDQTSP